MTTLLKLNYKNENLITFNSLSLTIMSQVAEIRFLACFYPVG